MYNKVSSKNGDVMITEEGIIAERS